MSRLTDQRFLEDQYKDASNLNTRIQLHERFSTNKYGWHRWVFDRFNLPPHCHVLELGCGVGDLWLKNEDRIPHGWEITLTDISPGMLAEIQENLEAVQHPFNFANVDAQSIPFSDACFDAVIANHMLYHVPDRNKAFSEIRRVLKSGGHFVAATNGENSRRKYREWLRPFVSAPAPSEEDAEGFSLQNGSAQLTPWFSDILVYHYEDTLHVTEVEPLIAYVLSSRTIPHDKIAEFARTVELEIAMRGAIHIVKEVGLFEAHREGIG